MPKKISSGRTVERAAARLHSLEFEMSLAVARRVARRVLGYDADAVDDVASSAVERVIRRPGVIISNMRGFIATAARNLAIDELRRRRRRGPVAHRTVDPVSQRLLHVPFADQLADPTGNPESQWIDRQEDPGAWLRSALASLTRRQREAVLVSCEGHREPMTAALRQARRAAIRRLRNLARQDGWGVAAAAARSRPPRLS